MTIQSAPLSIQPHQSQPVIGYLFALGTVLIWSSYFLSLRLGALSPLAQTDLALLRFTVPALLLLPWFVSGLKHYKCIPLRYVLGIVFAGGLPFFWFSASAMKDSSVMAGSTIIPGAAPFFVSLIAALFLRQTIGAQRKFGLSLIVVGIAFFLTMQRQSTPGGLTSLLVLLACAGLWAIFTVSVKLSGLKPLHVAALAATPNGLLIAIVAGLANEPSTFMHLGTTELLTQVVIQSFAVGICSGLLYSSAIRHLGAERTSAIGSLTPVIASLFGYFLLQEALDTLPLIGLTLTAAGVSFASRPS